jgi:hypothetical protein
MRSCQRIGWRFPPLFPAQGSAQDASLDRLREQVGLVSEQHFQELAVCFEPRFLIGLRIQLHGRSDLFVTQSDFFDPAILDDGNSSEFGHKVARETHSEAETRLVCDRR